MMVRGVECPSSIALIMCIETNIQPSGCLFNILGDLTKAASFTLPFEEDKDVTVADRSLHVTDDGTGLVLEELNADLGHVTGVACAQK
jgi:hypothetical protein